MKMTPEQRLQYLADLEYDRLREEGFFSPIQKRLAEEAEEKEREIIYKPEIRVKRG